ncbi:MAG: DUF3499 family protein [Actinomycetota bacterium]
MRSCQKQHCDRPAAVSVALRYGPKEVLVTDLLPESDRRLVEFCSDHAASLTPPFGWQLRDERRTFGMTSEPTLPLAAPYAPAV